MTFIRLANNSLFYHNPFQSYADYVFSLLYFVLCTI
jgi:hypothetical protein